MSAHWIFGGKKNVQSVYVPKPDYNNNAVGDYSLSANNNAIAKHEVVDDIRDKKPLVFVSSSYVLPGITNEHHRFSESIEKGEESIDAPPPVDGVHSDGDTKREDEVETETPPIVDPIVFIEEFRRKQSELEQMVERFCSVTAIKSESLASFVQKKSAQPVVSTINVQSDNLNTSTAKPDVANNKATMHVHFGGPPASHGFWPQSKAPIENSQPLIKKHLVEASQYLGEMSDVHYAFDNQTGNSSAAATALWTAPMKKPRAMRFDPSEYTFVLNGSHQ